MTDFPRVLIAVDKFKGSLSGVELSDAIARGMKNVLGSEFTPAMCPIADGGDGTVDTALIAGFREISLPVAGPLGESVSARFAFEDSSSTAVIEVAEACGLWRLNPGELDTWNASSYGVGELILAALDLGAQRIVVGLGGSATSDAGAGMLQALGVKMLDEAGRELSRGGGNLRRIGAVDISGLDQRIGTVDFTVACDVMNPLLGEHGAAAIYAPQKGASPEQVSLLEDGMEQFSNLLELNLGVSRETFSSREGAGAAGGLGFACLALGAEMRPGTDICFELTGFYDALNRADVVITGEGKLDKQTLQGKGPAGVSLAAQGLNMRTFAICGVNELTPEQAEEAGFERVFAVLDLEEKGQKVTLKKSLDNPRPYVEQLGEELAGYLCLFASLRE